ncbi:hypothetical protein [Lacunimicrobium album]
MNIDDFRVSDEMPVTPTRLITTPVSKGATHHFIKGPIPLLWLHAAARIPRKPSLLVGLELFHLAGLTKRMTGLKLTVKRMQPYGLHRKSVAAGLRDLEDAGLISVSATRPGCAKVIDILTVQSTGEIDVPDPIN